VGVGIVKLGFGNMILFSRTPSKGAIASLRGVREDSEAKNELAEDWAGARKWYGIHS
jgi:hypothetical protein